MTSDVKKWLYHVCPFQLTVARIILVLFSFIFSTDVYIQVIYFYVFKCVHFISLLTVCHILVHVTVINLKTASLHICRSLEKLVGPGVVVSTVPAGSSGTYWELVA